MVVQTFEAQFEMGVGAVAVRGTVGERLVQVDVLLNAGLKRNIIVIIVVLYEFIHTHASRTGDRAFSIAGPRHWNSLHVEIRYLTSFNSFIFKSFDIKRTLLKSSF